MKFFLCCAIFAFTYILSAGLAAASPDEGHSEVGTLSTIPVELKKLDNGPDYKSVDIPENGTGFTYVDVQSNAKKVNREAKFTLKLEKAGGEEVEVDAFYVKEGILRLAFKPEMITPADSIQFNTGNYLHMPDTIYIIHSDTIKNSLQTRDLE